MNKRIRILDYKMNKILLFVILFSSVCSAQDKLLDILPLKDAKVYYSKVLEVEGVSKIELFDRAKQWILDSGEFSNKIIYTDSKSEQIDCQGSFKELWGPNDYPELYTDVFYTVNLKFRNARYQYEITNFIIKKNGMETQIEVFKMEYKKNMKYNKLFYKRIDATINNLIGSIEKSMITGPVVQRIE